LASSRVSQFVARQHLCRLPVVEQQVEHAHQVRLRRQRLLLRLGHLLRRVRRAARQPRQLEEIHVERLQHLLQPRKREGSLREQPLDARLRQSDALRQVSVGHAAASEHALQRVEQLVGGHLRARLRSLRMRRQCRQSLR
jgi:hypothetical protein